MRNFSSKALSVSTAMGAPPQIANRSEPRSRPDSSSRGRLSSMENTVGTAEK
jgi:hypothetical protein